MRSYIPTFDYLVEDNVAYVKYLATHYAAEVQAAREKAAAEKPAVEAPVEPQPVADGEAKTDEPTAESTAAVEPARVILIACRCSSWASLWEALLPLSPHRTAASKWTA